MHAESTVSGIVNRWMPYRHPERARYMCYIALSCASVGVVLCALGWIYVRGQREASQRYIDWWDAKTFHYLLVDLEERMTTARQERPEARAADVWAQILRSGPLGSEQWIASREQQRRGKATIVGATTANGACRMWILFPNAAQDAQRYVAVFVRARPSSERRPANVVLMYCPANAGRIFRGQIERTDEPYDVLCAILSSSGWPDEFDPPVHVSDSYYPRNPRTLEVGSIQAR
jgi:hypothetical protein